MVGGWFGGTVLDLSAQKQTVLAATLAGLYRSTDGGQTWQPVGQDLPDAFTQAVAIAPGDDVAVAASRSGWLYRSGDGGATWQTVPGWGKRGAINVFAISPHIAQDGMILAGTAQAGIWKSTDRGRTWHAANFGLLNLTVTALAFSPNFARDEVIVAGTEGGGLFRSRNGGRAWRESGQGLPDATVQCAALAADGTILAGTQAHGLYRSSDNGRTWAAVALPETASNVNDLHLPQHGAGPLTLATDQAIWTSMDAGENWQRYGDTSFVPYALARTASALLVGTFGEGIYRSPLDQPGWQRTSTGLAAHTPPLACFSTAFARDGTAVLASLEGAVALTTDGGRSWVDVPEALQDTGATLLAGTGAGKAMSLLGASYGGLYKSQDSGQTWKQVLAPPEQPITALALSEQYEQDHTIAVGTSDGQVMRSQDGGNSWQLLHQWADGILIALHIPAPDLFWAVTARQNADGGWQLTLRTTGTEQAIYSLQSTNPVAAFHRDRETGSTLCAMGSHVLCLDGQTVQYESTLPHETPISALKAVAGTVWAGTRNGVYRAPEDLGAWEHVAPNLFVAALHAPTAHTLYVVEIGGRIWELNGP